jgi:site-specific DNA-cytosine methylase
LVCVRSVERAVKATTTILALAPRIILLEVRHADHSNEIIEKIKKAGYDKFDEIYSATEFGLPQDSKRTFVILAKEKLTAHSNGFPFPDGTCKNEPSFSQVLDENPDPSLWPGKVLSGCKVISQCDRIPSFQGTYYKTPKVMIEHNGPRKLSVKEVRRAFGIPDNFNMPVSDAHAYQLLGQSTWIPTSTEILKTILEWIK